MTETSPAENEAREVRVRLGGRLTEEPIAGAIADTLPGFDGLARRLVDGDATLWGPAAEAEASIRLGWLDAHRTSRELLPRLAELRAEIRAEGLDHIVLAGMGGSSLAPEVITRTYGAELTILDTTDPGQIRAAMTDRLDRTLVVLSSKSGGTVETDSHRRAYFAAFLNLGLSEAEAGRRFVVVTDPGSPLEKTAVDLGARAIFLADPHVGGRYSALTAFGLVPAALAGVDVDVLLDDAEIAHATLNATDSPALQLGVALGTAAGFGRDKVVLAEAGPGVAGLGDWAEQLIAESTGKEGTGLLPVVVRSPTAPGTTGPDTVLVTVRASEAAGPGADQAHADISVTGPLGAQFLAWEFAVAIAGRVLGINPFDQPDVEAAKKAARALLDSSADEPEEPLLVDDDIDVYGPADLFATSSTVDDVLALLCADVSTGGYLAVMAYLDRVHDSALARIRDPLAERTGHAVTFGWGPRFLHSTGQFHKGGTPNGVFLQVTGDNEEDLPVPDRPYTFGSLQRAQAAGDAGVLGQRGRPVVRLHLHDRPAGIARLLRAAGAAR
jgi:glucose-6-phosphate isomerase